MSSKAYKSNTLYKIIIVHNNSNYYQGKIIIIQTYLQQIQLCLYFFLCSYQGRSSHSKKLRKKAIKLTRGQTWFFLLLLVIWKDLNKFRYVPKVMWNSGVKVIARLKVFLSKLTFIYAVIDDFQSSISSLYLLTCKLS